MPGMPYTMEKGPLLSVIEDYANQSPAQYLDCLRRLRSGDSIADLPPLTSKTLDHGPLKKYQDRVDHMKHDFFGWPYPTNNAGQPTGTPRGPQPPFDEKNGNVTTGFWTDWYGDCEGIVRESLIRAAEVALGLDHDAEPPNGRPVRHWWLELLWSCPSPWFEGWVTWRKHGEGFRDGQVTVIISTPGHGGPLINTPLRKDGYAPEYLKNPVSANGDQGVWVTTASYHRPFVKTTVAASGLGEWTFPTLTLGYQSIGEIVTVAVAEHEGGVLADGRPYQP